MLIYLFFKLLAYAVGSLEFHCKEKRISVCDRNEFSENVVFVSTVNEEFLKTIKDTLCSLDHSETVKELYKGEIVDILFCKNILSVLTFWKSGFFLVKI